LGCAAPHLGQNDATIFITALQLGHTFVSGPPAGCFPHFGQESASPVIPVPQCIQYLFGGSVGGDGFFLIKKMAITTTITIIMITSTMIRVISDPPEDVVVVVVVVVLVVVGEVVAVVVGVVVVDVVVVGFVVVEEEVVVGVVVVVVVVVTVVVVGVVVVIGFTMIFNFTPVLADPSVALMNALCVPGARSLSIEIKAVVLMLPPTGGVSFESANVIDIPLGATENSDTVLL